MCFSPIASGLSFPVFHLEGRGDIPPQTKTTHWSVRFNLFLRYINTVRPKGPVKKYLPIALAKKQPIT